ncbi:MAG: hypothetical protein Q4A34_01950 [Candidatus Saccharibacteria bacterium]|nr:hypothetical protein [Candidatus Saccharibacteria bacterium]
MDANGKPMMSRELLERLTKTAPESVGAFGATTVNNFRERRQQDFGSSRKMVGQYGRSSLGAGAARQAGANAATPLRREGDPVNDTAHNPGIRSRQSRGNGSVQTDAKRPSAGFQEPPSRRYDPYR